MQRYSPALHCAVSASAICELKPVRARLFFPQRLFAGHRQMPGFRRAVEQES